MANQELVYFVNSQGQTAYLSHPNSNNYWEMKGRYGFKAPKVRILSTNYASGKTRYDGKIIQPRECGMKMICIGKSTAERDKIFFQMLDVLLDAEGTGEGKLYVRRSDGSTVYLNCVYGSGMDIVEEYDKFQRFTVEFYAADPWFYWTQETLINTPNQVIHNPFDDVVYPEIFAFNPGNSQQRKLILNRNTSQRIEFYTTDETLELFSKQITDLTINLSPTERYVDALIEKYSRGLSNNLIHSATYWGQGQEAIVGDVRYAVFSLVPGDNIIANNWSSSNGKFCFTIRKKFAGA